MDANEAIPQVWCQHLKGTWPKVGLCIIDWFFLWAGTLYLKHSSNVQLFKSILVLESAYIIQLSWIRWDFRETQDCFKCKGFSWETQKLLYSAHYHKHGTKSEQCLLHVLLVQLVLSIIILAYSWSHVNFIWCYNSYIPWKGSLRNTGVDFHLSRTAESYFFITNHPARTWRSPLHAFLLILFSKKGKP